MMKKSALFFYFMFDFLFLRGRCSDDDMVKYFTNILTKISLENLLRINFDQIIKINDF